MEKYSLFSITYNDDSVPESEPAWAKLRRVGCWGLAVALLSGCAALGSLDEEQVAVWISTNDRQMLLAASREAFEPQAEKADIVVRPQVRYQRMRGFGASITDASAWLIQHRMTPQQRRALMLELFGRENDGLGFDFARLTIGASDFSRSHFSLDDTLNGKPDETLEHFNLSVHQADAVSVAQDALKINPQLWLMASPWSAPGWMKDSGSLIKGRLLPRYNDAFAHYLQRYIEEMADMGVPIHALTVQNEPDFEPGNYPGMRLNAPERARFIGDHLGPLLAKRSPEVQILDWDHNWNKPDEPLAVLADVSASRYLKGVAWHCYGGQPTAQTAVRDAYPDKDVYLTECSGGDWEPVRSGGLTLQAERLIIGATRNWARGVLFWNLALDENGGPHAGGCGNCRGVVTIHSTTGEVTRTDDYYALAHVSRFVRRGAWRVASTEGKDVPENVAFVNADDDSRVLILSNAEREAKEVRVQEGGRQFRHTIPAKSVVTFVWHPTH